MAKKRRIKEDIMLPRLPLEVLEKISRFGRVESKKEYNRKADRKKFKDYIEEDK